MNDKIFDFIFLRMNDFERLSRNEPSNSTAFESVRLCADILFRLGVNFCCVNGVWRKLLTGAGCPPPPAALPFFGGSSGGGSPPVCNLSRHMPLQRIF